MSSSVKALKSKTPKMNRRDFAQMVRTRVRERAEEIERNQEEASRIPNLITLGRGYRRARHAK